LGHAAPHSSLVHGPADLFDITPTDLPGDDAEPAEPDMPVVTEAGDELTIGYSLFSDGTYRAVRLDNKERQFILDLEDERVYGVWLKLSELPTDVAFPQLAMFTEQMHALAFPCADFSDSFLAQHHALFSCRRFQRGSKTEPEYRFHCRDRDPCLPVWHDGQLQLVWWGQGHGLPRTSWTWEATIAEKWSSVDNTEVIIPARLGLMAGVWYPIFEGVKGLLVKDRIGRDVVYVIVQPASHYYQVMTRATWMPALVNQTI
jgi:hypothetical protein